MAADHIIELGPEAGEAGERLYLKVLAMRLKIPAVFLPVTCAEKALALSSPRQQQAEAKGYIKIFGPRE